MSVIFEKARELGELIRESEQSVRLADAKTAFESDPEAVRKLAMFREAENSGQQQGDVAAALKREPVIGELIEAEDAYHALLDQTVDVLRMTVLGDAADDHGAGPCGGRTQKCGR